ncbi:MAG: ABC transporter substrate-binding protein [Betaproteobacteria bacterium]|nr:ABC transporter substrate-binding protein [Betaproteobacteria bacterium]
MKKGFITLLAFLIAPVAFSQAPAPQRIVSLDLCTDWLLTLHVEQGRVAALSPMQRAQKSFHPAPWMKDKTSWPSHDGSPESIAFYEPDLILVGQYAAISLREQLRRLGFRVEVLPLATTLEGVRDYERQFLAHAGLPPERAGNAPPARPLGKKRLLLLGANAIGTGRNTFEDAILTRSGWRNYLTEEGLVRLDLEQIARDPPDAVLWAAPSGAALANAFAEHPLWRSLTPPPSRLDTDYWRWQCPGPWSWDLIRELDQLARQAEEEHRARTP